MRAIATIASPISGEVRVFRDAATGCVTYVQGGYEQSAADATGVATATYIHVLYGLLRQQNAARVAVIGGAGGTLATMLARSGVAVALVDIDPAAFRIARSYFALPDACECHTADGQAFLKEHVARRFDAIVLDAYDAARLPGHLATSAFFALVKRRLAKGGALFVNAYVTNDADPLAKNLARAMTAVWKTVRTLDRKGATNRNAVVMAGAVEKLTQPVLIMAPQFEAAEIAQDLRRLRFTR